MDKEKKNLLPEFLKEIQEEMNHLKDENKKLKEKNVILQQSSKGSSDFLSESEFRKDKDLKKGLMNENNVDNINETNVEIRSVKKKIIKKKK